MEILIRRFRRYHVITDAIESLLSILFREDGHSFVI
jgi:hypothetical protein